MTQEVLKLALEALERSVATCFDQYAHRQVMSQPDHFINQAITAIKEALRENAMREVQRLGQEIKQEPVVLEAVYETIIQWDEGGGKRSRRELARRIVALYTTPPQRTWVGLTKEEVLEFTRASWGVGVTASEFIRAIEDKLKDKNDVAQKTNS